MSDDQIDWQTLVDSRFALRDAVSLFDRNNIGMRRSALRNLAPGRDAIPFLAARTFWGEPMLVFNDEEVSRQLFAFGSFETPLVNFMTRYLQPGDTVFDVGAHVGFFALLATRLVGEHGAVHAFEPTPTTFSLLKRNIGWHPAARLARAAAWSRAGQIVLHTLAHHHAAYNTARQFRLPDTDPAALESASIEVPCLALDDYAAAHGAWPAFVKIDVENAERDVIAGMRRLFAEVRPVVSLEVGDEAGLGSPEIGSSRDLLQRVMAHDYVPLEARRDRFHLHALRDDWRYAYDNVLMVPREALPPDAVEPGTEVQVCAGGFRSTGASR